MTISTRLDERLTKSLPFLEHVLEWESRLPDRALDDLVQAAGGADHVAVACVDLVKGFAVAGPLSGPRVAAIVPPIRDLVVAARERGVHSFVFLQDCHPADSPEFESWPPHCVAGTEEAEMVDDLAGLPFADTFTVLPKTSVDASAGTGLESWLAARPQLRAIVVVGDCTDICTYQLAMYLRTRDNVRRAGCRVVVPADCVATYDLPVPTARELGAMPHDGDLLHRLFLYQMQLNGIEVVGRLAAASGPT